MTDLVASQIAANITALNQTVTSLLSLKNELDTLIAALEQLVSDNAMLEAAITPTTPPTS